MIKEALIFGAFGALGRGVTEELIQKDFYKVYLFDLHAENELFRNENIEAITVKDLSVEANVQEALKAVSPSKKKYLFLFSTIGGYSGGKPVWQTDHSELEKMMKMNFTTNFLIAKYFAALVENSAGGSICMTGAFTGEFPEEGKSAYGASKSALIHFIKTLAIEGKKINLSANIISPHILDTPGNREWIKEADYEKWTKPQEVGKLVSFLFDNFQFISGNNIFLTERISLKTG